MTISPNTQAILLLTAHFSKQDTARVKPLTPREWGRFAESLRRRSLTPERLLSEELKGLLNGWQDKTISVERLELLLNRGSALAFSMEKWLRSGLWVMTRSDLEYPRRLKERLRGDSPAVLFGCGNKALANSGGLAVVGSRSAGDSDLAYSRNLGELAARTGYSIISGGARGVDEAAMRGALEAEGTSVGVLADGLLRACSSSKYRQYLVSNNLLLLSPFNPEAGFNAGNAMQRNKYIYCLAHAAIAVHSGKKGGTWSGAREDLKHRWVTLWVKPNKDPEAGNNMLIREGAAVAPENVEDVDIKEIILGTSPQHDKEYDLFMANAENAKEDNAAYSDCKRSQTDEREGVNMVAPANDEAAGRPHEPSFYELFLAKVQTICREEPRKRDELVKLLDLTRSQVDVWLKQAIADGRLKKLNKPVRYQWIDGNQASLDFK